MLFYSWQCLTYCMKLFGGTYNLHDKHVHVYCRFLIKEKLRHSLGRPSRSDLVQFEFGYLCVAK